MTEPSSQPLETTYLITSYDLDHGFLLVKARRFCYRDSIAVREELCRVSRYDVSTFARIEGDAEVARVFLKGWTEKAAPIYFPGVLDGVFFAAWLCHAEAYATTKALDVGQAP